MHHFFVKDTDIIEDKAYIIGDDRFHAVNVLRLKPGEEILISDEEGHDHRCVVEGYDEEKLSLHIVESLKENHELSSELWLFQGLPKADKMELIIQKATELGVSHVVPMLTKNIVSRPDERKLSGKLKRWQAIAEAAAKQSKRSRIPIIHEPIKFTDAVSLASELDMCVMAYEDERGMEGLSETIVGCIPQRSIGVMIGPEGGFDPLEQRLAAMKDIAPVSLGKRILRTETAAITLLSIIMIRLEIAEAAFRSGE